MGTVVRCFVVVHSSQISTKRIAFKPAVGQPVKTEKVFGNLRYNHRTLGSEELTKCPGKWGGRGKQENEKIANNEDLRVP